MKKDHQKVIFFHGDPATGELETYLFRNPALVSDIAGYSVVVHIPSVSRGLATY